MTDLQAKQKVLRVLHKCDEYKVRSLYGRKGRKVEAIAPSKPGRWWSIVSYSAVDAEMRWLGSGPTEDAAWRSAVLAKLHRIQNTDEEWLAMRRGE